MNAYASPYAASHNSNLPLRNSRDIEYDAFSRATSALKAALAEDTVPTTTAALHLNSTLWNTLMADLSTEGNGLPSELRANLISLAIFSVRHAFLIPSGRGKIEPLIDINLAVMRGLRGEL